MSLPLGFCPQVTVASKSHIHTIQKINPQVNGDKTLLILKESKGFTELRTAEKGEEGGGGERRKRRRKGRREGEGRDVFTCYLR